MSFVLGTLLSLAGLLFAILAWQALPMDRVGKRARERRQETGFQGRLTEWLYWDAPLQSPRLAGLESSAQERLSRVGDRALFAVVNRVQVERGLSAEEAHALLLKERRSGAARAFLNGRMRRATRLHWETRYAGPPFLFMPWYYLVAMVRYGRRHLYLETLTAVLQEMRK